jgi:hypothetical protein
MRADLVMTQKSLSVVIVEAALTVLGIAGVAEAATFTVPVLEDESVYLKQGKPNFNLDGSTKSGGLFTGVDGSQTASAARFYLKFALPAYVPETQVTSAILTGYYNDDYNQADDGTHGIYFVASDSWSEATLTWNNQPAQAYGLPEATFSAVDATVGSFVSWDITRIVDQEYRGDRQLSLLFHAENEGLTQRNNNWEYFAEREFDPGKAFRIELTTASKPIPEPSSTLGILAFGVLSIGSALKRKRRSK